MNSYLLTRAGQPVQSITAADDCRAFETIPVGAAHEGDRIVADGGRIVARFVELPSGSGWLYFVPQPASGLVQPSRPELDPELVVPESGVMRVGPKSLFICQHTDEGRDAEPRGATAERRQL